MPEKKQPDLDFLLKMGAQFLAERASEFMDQGKKAATKTEPESDPRGKERAEEVIARVVARHRAFSVSPDSMIVCACGFEGNAMAYNHHVAGQIVATLETPDPVKGWWESVTDQP